MTPSAFVFLPALPLTPNGKVDRKALPAPDLSAESERVFAPAHTPTEQTLSAIWSEVLGLPRVGIHDNFFELGGHSLLAAQVMSRVGRACHVDMPISELFQAPTVAELAGRIEEGRGSRVAGPQRNLFRSSLAPRPSPLDTSPLSFAQERLWFLEQMEPGQAFNNIPLAIRLEGRLEIAALRRAFDDIVSRHTPLRTAFNTTNGQPVAVVASAQPIQLPIVDLTGLPQTQREREAERLSQEEARQPFDLTQSPLLRVKLARLNHADLLPSRSGRDGVPSASGTPASAGRAHDEYLLLLTPHHIACDGWSLGVFYRELAALYEAQSTGRQSPLPELPIDYADFADWQRHWLQGQVLDDQLAYWKQRLSGAQTTLDLPTDRPRPPLQTYHGDIQHFALPSDLATTLNALARREDATLFMVLLAAFQTLLHRYTGQQDILVGSSSAGRSRVETEGLIGLFLNTLVLRGDLSDDPPFRKLVSRVRQVALEAYAHQDLPFEKLVEALPLPRDLSRSPLFQVMFILQNEPLRPLELAGLKLTPVPAHSGTAKFELTLSLEEMEDGLAGYIEFNSDLFDKETIVRMLGHYQTLLEAVVADADQCLSALPLLTKHERKQILLVWNDTQADFDEDSCVHQVFERQVARNPDAIAAVFEDEHLTYRELNESANEVARELQVLGAGPDVRVGICVERSLEMMIGLLGILKSGGCYVPLDPKYPKERLAFMLEDAQVPVLLTQEKLQSQFKFELPNLKLVSLDSPRFERGAGSAECGVSPRAGRTPHSTLHTPHSKNLAYVIYTSGSTGKPKGVMVTHRNVANFFAGMDDLLGAKPGVWLAVTSISFDISVLELFWTLARGYKVVIQPDAATTGGTPGAAIAQQILRHGVTHLQCTPSFANALILAPESLQALGRLKKLLLGGEALPVSLAQLLSAVVPGGLLNMYGPTETTVWSATHPVGEVAHSVPIGRPIANTQIYILDHQLQPVPAGVPGEILIGGEGVARGYLNRPELTAQKFIPNPVKLDLESRRQAPSPTRLYRTGDLGRWRRDGAIEFLGRLDQQVKIRGHRIELGEIEGVLGRHPAVREVAVVAREDQPGDQRLIAYFVAASGARPKAGELRQFAQEKLPEAMVPAACVFLDEMPRTPNGKIDRKALPAHRGDRPELETSFVAPRTQMERTIARIWQELLGVEKVGLHDNFFDLGGHSLLVVRAQSQLQLALGAVLPVVKLFQYPTISALAGFLSEREPASAVRIGNRGWRKQAAFAERARQRQEVLA